MTTIYLIRHGAYHSPKPVVPYRLPGYHLSEEGIAQAKSRAEALKNEPIVAVFTSPMERTFETATILASEHNLAPMTDDRLLEVRSPAQGMTKEEITSHGVWDWTYYESDWYKKSDGETLRDIVDRMKHFLEEKRQEFEGKTIVVVSHGDPIMLATAYYQKKSITPASLLGIPYVPMAGGYRIDFEGKQTTIQSL